MEAEEENRSFDCDGFKPQTYAREVRKMLWTIMVFIVAEFIIIAFLIPVIAAVILGVEIARFASEGMQERMRSSIHRAHLWSLPKKASGPMCPWEPHRAGHAH